MYFVGIRGIAQKFGSVGFGLLFCTALLVISERYFEIFEYQPSASGLKGILADLKTFKPSGLKEIQGIDLPRIHPQACVRSPPLAPQAISFIMCAKPNDLVSDYILRDGIWMQNEVELLISLILDYPNSTFLDLGANLGTFSVAAAAFKHRVIAVDPFLLNHAYSRMSTFLFGSEENVRYLVNTISDGKEALYPFYRFPGNEGGISFINQETAKTKPANLIGEPVYPVTLKEILDSITTDTVIIKIDVEGSECVALTPYLTQPIKKKNIPYFLMEWTYIFQNIDDCCPGISTLIKGFLDSGYYAVEVATLQRVNMTEPQNWENILWVHNEAFRQF